MTASDSYLSLARLIRDARFIDADRREIAQRRGLLKDEQLQALARGTVYYGHRGRIVYWQASEISRLARRDGLPLRYRPASSCQPHRAQERHPLRRGQDRPRQAH